MTTRPPGGAQSLRPLNTVSQHLLSRPRCLFTMDSARLVYPRTCCRPSGTFSAHTRTSASISHAVSFSIQIGLDAGAEPPPAATTCDLVQTLGKVRCFLENDK